MRTYSSSVRGIWIAIAVAAAAGCGGGGADASHVKASGRSSTGSSAAKVDALPAEPDPCGFATAAEIANIFGPLAGAPRRGAHYDSPEPDNNGRACVYTLPSSGGASPEPNTIAVEVRGDDAAAGEAGFRAGQALEEGLMKQLGANAASESQAAAAHDGVAAANDGWDYHNALPSEYFGRVGHVAVHVGVRVYPRANWDGVQRLAALVRDRIPDRPFAAPEYVAHADARDPDPCTVLAPADVEPVLGRLSIPPYRSIDDGPLADRRGAGCSYYTTKHHVLSLKPEWSLGKQLFAVSAGASGFFGGAAGIKAGVNGLQGPWDRAATGIDGSLVFLKGDRMLTLAYRAANISRDDALKLATLAVQRLGS